MCIRDSQYVQLRKMYLEVNLTLIIVIFTFISIIFDYFSDLVKSYVIILLILYLVIAGYNIYFNLRAHKTEFEKDQSEHKWKLRNKINGYLDKFHNKLSKKSPTINSEMNFWTTNRFFRGNVPEKVQDLGKYLSNFALNKFNFAILETENIELDLKEKLLKDDLKNLFILFWYQKNYFKHAMMTRMMTLISIIYILVSSILIILKIFLC